MRAQLELNNDCRQRHKKFYYAHSIGLSGFVFADLAEHDYIMCAPGLNTSRAAHTVQRAHRPVG